MLKNKLNVAETPDSSNQVKNLLFTLLPPGKTYHAEVSKDRQAKKLDLLNQSVSAENFYFVFNLLTCELENMKGVEKCLGYPVKEFTYSRYLNSIHPAQAIQHTIIAGSMYQLLCKGVFRLHFSTQQYISLIALKHNNGNYIVFKKTTSVFQYTKNNRLLAQLNEFAKIDVYDGTPLKPRISEMEGLQKQDFERVVFEMVLKTFMEKKYFSGHEFLVLKHYAEHETISSRELAKLLDVAVLTIDTYNKRILEKARKTFSYSFVNAREVALYLKKEKILHG